MAAAIVVAGGRGDNVADSMQSIAGLGGAAALVTGLFSTSHVMLPADV
jgi:hypothetical protein